MKIVVLGATGTTGGFAVQEALDAGHRVVAFVRNAAALTPRAGMTVVAGSVEDVGSMRTAFEGADAVVSCLGVRPTAGLLLRGTDFQRRMLPKLISALDEAGVKRFVLMSSLGVGDTAAKQGFISRVLLSRVIAGRLFDDKAIAERALEQCRANWTTVYPVGLRKGPIDPGWALVPLDSVRSVPGLPMLSFATVARVLIELVVDEGKPKSRLLLTTARGWR